MEFTTQFTIPGRKISYTFLFKQQCSIIAVEWVRSHIFNGRHVNGKMMEQRENLVFTIAIILGPNRTIINHFLGIK